MVLPEEGTNGIAGVATVPDDPFRKSFARAGRGISAWTVAWLRECVPQRTAKPLGEWPKTATCGFLERYNIDHDDEF
jgi:hypothetical protein